MPRGWQTQKAWTLCWRQKSTCLRLFQAVFSSDEDDDDDEDEEPAEETEASPEEVLQYAWETVCYVIWGQSQRQGWSESGGSSFGGTEGTLPTDFYSDNEEPGRKWWPAMSLPKRDGVQGRYYLIQKPDTNPEVLEHADQCIQDVLDWNCKRKPFRLSVVVRTKAERPFFPATLLERYLSKLPLKGFPTRKLLYSAMPYGGWWAGGRLATPWENTSNTRCRRGFLRLERMRTTFRLSHSVPHGRSYGRRMWTRTYCALPAMWRSAIRCMEPAIIRL